MSDGELHEKEVATLEQVFRELAGLEIDRGHIHKAYENVMGASGHSPGLSLSIPAKNLGTELKDLIIKSSYLMMVSDGKIVDHETEKLAEIAAQLEVDDDRFVRLIREISKRS